MSQYQKTPDPGNYKPGFKPNPQTPIVVTGQGTVAKPVPPAKPTFKRSLKPPPTAVKAPGASGTI
jgi:hypothetical protein